MEREKVFNTRLLKKASFFCLLLPKSLISCKMASRSDNYVSCELVCGSKAVAA